MKIPLVGPHCKGRHPEVNAREAVNLYLEKADVGGKEALVWVGTPGLKDFGTPSAVLRGKPIIFGSYIYYAAGQKLYRMDSAGTEAELGTLTTNSGNNVQLAHNRTQVMVVDGTAEYFVYDTDDSTFYTVNKFSTEVDVTDVENLATTTYIVTTATAHGGAVGETARITGTTNFSGVVTITSVLNSGDVDDGLSFRFTHANGTDSDETGLADAKSYMRTDTLTITPTSCDYIDGYGLLNNSVDSTDSTNGVSKQAFFRTRADDFTTIQASHYGAAQRDPDDLKRIHVNGGDIWLFGEYSTELYFNDGTSATFPFAAARSAALPYGIASPWTVANVGTGVAWLAQTRHGEVTPVIAEGYEPRPLSNHALSYEVNSASSISTAVAQSYEEDGHKFYVLHLDDTWAYDHAGGADKLWHKRESYDGSSYGPWRGKWYVRAFGKHLWADKENAKILQSDLDTYTELDSATSRSIRRYGVSAYIHKDDEYVTHSRIGVLMGATGGELTLSYSDDAGTTWTEVDTKTFSRLLEFYQVGLSEVDRLYKVQTTSAVRVVIVGAYTDAEGEDGP